MTGLPTLLVELDDGTGTFPYDITEYVSLSSGWSIGPHGRPDELQEVQATSLNLTLDNTDGRFTLGAALYNDTYADTYGETGVHVDQRIRVTETVGATVSRRFTGYVQAWPTTWPTGGGETARSPIVATDMSPRWGRRSMKSVLRQEIGVDDPYLYYPCDEQQGSLYADSIGQSDIRLIRAGGDGQYEFGAEYPAPTEDTTGSAVLYKPGWPAQPALRTGQTIQPGSAFTLEAVVTTRPAGSPEWEVFHLSSTTTQAEVWLTVVVSSGVAGVNALMVGPTGTPAIVSAAAPGFEDGEAHHVALTVSGTTLRVYCDGVQVGTDGSSAAIGGSDDMRLTSGAYVNSTLDPGDKAALCHLALTLSAPSGARIAAHSDAALNGFINDTSDVRIGRYLDVAGVDPAARDLETGVLSPVPHLDTAGMKVSEALARVVAAEGGVLFVAGDGDVTLHNRHHASLQTSAKMVFAAVDVDPNVAVEADTQRLINVAIYKAVTGAEQEARDNDSVLLHEEWTDSADLLVATPDEALARAQWTVALYAEPSPRIPDLTIDLLTSSQSLVEGFLALEVGDRIQVTDWPTQAPGSTLDLIVEGWTEQQSATAWTLTLSCSPWEQAGGAVWILGDATYGVLGSTTRLHY